MGVDRKRSRAASKAGVKEESKIERAVVKAVRQRSWIAEKVNITHWPDRMFISPAGLVCFIEFKRPGGVLSQGQAVVLATLKARGVPAEIFDDSDKALKWLSQISMEHFLFIETINRLNKASDGVSIFHWKSVEVTYKDNLPVEIVGKFDNADTDTDTDLSPGPEDMTRCAVCGSSDLEIEEPLEGCDDDSVYYCRSCGNDVDVL